MIDEKHFRNLFWWKPKRKFLIWKARDNLGDALSLFITRKTLESLLTFDLKINSKSDRMLFAIGSILNHAKNNDVVWGSGINGTKASNSYNFNNLDVRATRGPITRSFLESKGIRCPNIFGDPGILISRFIQPHVEIDRDEVFIPHFSQINEDFSDIQTLSTIGNDFQNFVNEICRSKIVYSSSLHGLIIAESYGIPAILTNMAERENILKYKDYYLGTGRSEFPVAKTVEEARTKIPPEIPNVLEIQNRLIESFPLDFWK